MDQQEQALLLSLKPIYADLIFNGKKTVELRRIRPSVEPGQKAYAYASSPTKALVGQFWIGSITSLPPSQLWRKCGKGSAVSKAIFDSYFSGCEVAHGLSIIDPVLFDSPIQLSILRDRLHRFNPPQSFGYISFKDIQSLAPSLISV